ncbi:MAG: UDP-glucose/GDP-mannose dehydrogenase family protein [Spirochaetales bacterium]|uniref:UDP-glucose 6-dehydrogenase n=1 Tax=Candidatus Thalassospirochaeta sargassi TaxID=3119039 RepID=A0AAJ1IC80_9SPIO|nr:UDP-glucose/GDP-mannose dehydrogenase family protein [Spirochaetales bacterium]
MPKKICVVGTGYVGLIAAVGLSDFGNNVVGVDLDKKKIDMLVQGISPIYEPGVEDYLNRNLESGRLTFTTEIAKALQESNVIFIAVGTPEKENEEADLSYVEAVVDTIAENLNEYKVIVTKSTVPVGTNRWIKELLKKKTGGNNFDVVSNPEFLREGKAAQDFFHPDRTVIGYESEKAKDIMFRVYRTLNVTSVPFVWCSLETAELIKYASNAFLATKITFINEIANLSEAVGADIHQVAKSMGMDGRISSKFLHPGPGYGGSCFPKDTKAIVSFGKKFGVKMKLIDSVIKTNELQKERMVEKIKKLSGTLKGKTITVLGLAFKQQTDDVRESPAITIIDKLLKEGVNVQAHDPKAMDNFSKLFPDIMYCHTAYDAAKNADALLIVTEWNEYRGLELSKLKTIMKGDILLDTRNLLDPDDVKEAGFIYEGVGRK